VKLARKKEVKEDVELTITTQYFDEENKKHVQQSKMKLPLGKTDFYANNSVRKAIILSRYVNLMKHWIRDTSTAVKTPTISRESGILVPSVVPPKATTSTKTVTPHYRDLFQQFMKYLEGQSDDLKDDKLVSDLEEKLNAIVSAISFGDVQSIFNEMKDKVIAGDGMPFDKVLEVIKSKLQGTPNEQQLNQLKQLIEADVYNSSDLIFEKFVSENMSDIVGGFTAPGVEAFLKKEVSPTIFGYLHPHIQNRVLVRIQNHSTYKVVYDLVKKNSSESDLEKKIGGALTPDLKKFVMYMKEHPKEDAEGCIRANSWEMWG